MVAYREKTFQELKSAILQAFSVSLLGSHDIIGWDHMTSHDPLLVSLGGELSI